jgi:hypothetical protein
VVQPEPLDKGFEVARKGTNGFHTFVARTGGDAMRGSWPLTRYRDDISVPDLDAPNVSNDNVGGVTPGHSPYPFVILHGPHGYVIQHVGKAETAAITKEHQGMLARLCSINRLWCLPTSNGQ